MAMNEYRECPSVIEDDACEASTVTEEEGSDDEFLRILDICRTRRITSRQVNDDEECEDSSIKVNKTCNFDPEYYSLPAVEDPGIYLVDDVVLMKFGIVERFIDFMAIIKPDEGVPHLDYDTILFDADRNGIGEVFEIFGTVKNTSYTLRFNTSEEAQSRLSVGSPIFFAPHENLITKTILVNELIKMKIADNVDPEEDEAFSDDEEEARHRLRVKAKNRASPFEFRRFNSNSKRQRFNNRK